MFTNSKGLINKSKSEPDFSQYAGVVIILFLVFYILHIGASFIIPFIVALLFSFAILGLSNLFKKFKIPSFFAMSLSLATYIGVFWLIGNLINANIQDLINLLPAYQEKLLIIFESIFKSLGIEQPKSFSESMNNINLQDLLVAFGSALASIFSNVGIILFYVLFILLEHRHFSSKLSSMVMNDNRERNIMEVISQIKKDVKAYFVIKTAVSFCTGFMSYIILASFGVDFAMFWAFVIFIFNFIPTVGSVVAVTFPVALAMVQFSSYYLVLGLLLCLAGVQILMGNIIEPRFVGNKLNLSPLLIILSLAFWGYIWGVVGMLLSVPIMVIVNIILSKFEKTRPIAILFSEKGDLKTSLIEGEKNRKELVKKIKKRLFF